MQGHLLLKDGYDETPCSSHRGGFYGGKYPEEHPSHNQEKEQQGLDNAGEGLKTLFPAVPRTGGTEAAVAGAAEIDGQAKEQGN